MNMNPRTIRIAKRSIGALIGYTILASAIIVAVFPLIWMFVSSIKPTTEIYSIPPTFTVYDPTLENYARVLFETNIPRTFLNSIFISTTATASAVLISVFAAYGLSRVIVKGGRTLSVGMLFGQMMPAIVLLIPLFRMYANLGWIDTYRVNIVTNIATNLPMAVLVMTAFFASIPKELDEAAMIDGCSRIQALFRILMPVSKPGLVTVGIFSFLNTWEEFLFALNFAPSTAFRTLAVAIRDFRGQFIIDWGGLMSAAMVVAIPVLFVFLLCSKYFIKGITSGSVKG